MDMSQMKNIVVLKNLPSNIVEEAIVVLKPNQKVRQVEHIEKNIGTEKNKKITNPKEYIVKEAEMIVSNYITNMDNKKNQNNKSMKTILQKYNRLKVITFLLGAGIIVYGILKTFT